MNHRVCAHLTIDHFNVRELFKLNVNWETFFRSTMHTVVFIYHFCLHHTGKFSVSMYPLPYDVIFASSFAIVSLRINHFLQMAAVSLEELQVTSLSE